ncbi:hypothetical protein CLV35_0154 [Motilibacter peucedani]|uniref:Uncharacterized protein n=1 Tax=Motilibacter peucedani TaxID=598650 RepID=A0A420XV30_9ACTN|nr:hypothetical protein [Motilibacter peucedani]RKS80688.1 hypothetical protein CLV35_0154 [Motilibacter peucedani]
MKRSTLGAATAALALAALLPQQAAQAADHTIGRGTVLAAGTDDMNNGEGIIWESGSGRVRHLGAGTWKSQDFYECGFDEDGAYCDDTYYFDFWLADGSGSLTGMDPDSPTVQLQGTGSLAGWSGRVSLVRKTVGHRDVRLFEGEITAPAER